jgi:hypothetical protein
MFCWPGISIYAYNEANLMHYLSSVYSVTIRLHVSGLLVAHHQEVTMYICDNWYVLYWKEDCIKLLNYILNKLKINSESSWFYYMHKTNSSTRSLKSVLDGEGGQRHAPAALPPGKRPVVHCIGGWVGHRAGLDGCGKSRPHQDSIPEPSSP